MWINVFSVWMQIGFVLLLVGFFAFPNDSLHRDVYYNLVVLPFVLSLPLLNYGRFYRAPGFLMAVMFVVYLGLTTLWSPSSGKGLWVRGLRDVIYILSLLHVTAFLVLRYPLLFDKLMFLILFVAGFAGCIILMDFYSAREWDFSKVLIPEWKFGNKNRVAKSYGLIFLLAVCASLYAEKKATVMCCFLVAAIALTLIFLSRSAGAAYAVLISLPFLVLLRGNGRAWLVRYWQYVIGPFVLLVGILYSLDIADRFVSAGWSRRDVIWLAILEQFKEQSIVRLFFGTGFLVDASVLAIDGERYYHEHNLFLAILRQSGLVGVLLFLGLLSASFYGLLGSRNHLHRVWGLLLFYGLLASMSGGTYPLYKPEDSWLWVWVPIGFVLALAGKAVEDRRQLTSEVVG